LSKTNFVRQMGRDRKHSGKVGIRHLVDRDNGRSKFRGERLSGWGKNKLNEWLDSAPTIKGSRSPRQEKIRLTIRTI